MDSVFTIEDIRDAIHENMYYRSQFKEKMKKMYEIQTKQLTPNGDIFRNFFMKNLIILLNLYSILGPAIS